MERHETFTLGTIAGTHALKGELRVYIDADEPARYSRIKEVWLAPPKQQGPLQHTAVSALKTLDGQHLYVLTLPGITTPEAAEQLKNYTLHLPLSLLPPLDGKKFYYHEVTGYDVVDSRLGPLGRILGVAEQPGQDVLEVLHPSGRTILAPILDQFIDRIDRQEGVFYLHLPPGLADVYLDDDAEPDDADEEPADLAGKRSFTPPASRKPKGSGPGGSIQPADW